MSAATDARERTKPHWQVGARLTRARNDRGTPQSLFAQSLGVSQPTLSQWERGRRLPSPDALTHLATLGVDIGWILTGEPTTEASDVDA